MLWDKNEQQQQFHADLLKESKRILDKHGIYNILSGSALLGIIRDGDLVPWQLGIVLIVMIEQVQPKTEILLQEFKNAGFTIKKYFNNKTNWKIRMYRGVYTVEIVGYYKHKKMYIRKSKKRIREVPLKHYLNCKNTIDFRGCTYTIPNEPKKYLEHLYGPEWKTPVRSEKASDFRAETHCRKIERCIKK